MAGIISKEELKQKQEIAKVRVNVCLYEKINKAIVSATEAGSDKTSVYITKRERMLLEHDNAVVDELIANGYFPSIYTIVVECGTEDRLELSWDEKAKGKILKIQSGECDFKHCCLIEYMNIFGHRINSDKVYFAITSVILGIILLFLLYYIWF